jgi:uncharacterized protein YceK
MVNYRHFYIWILFVVAALAGCATVSPQPLPEQRSKAYWKTKVVYEPAEILKSTAGKPLKYEADEAWVFRPIPSVADHWYFKGDKLVAIEHVSRDVM